MVVCTSWETLGKMMLYPWNVIRWYWNYPLNDKAVNFKTFKKIIWEMALIWGYLFWKQLYLSGVLHWSFSFGADTNFSFYLSFTSTFSLKKGSYQSRLYWLCKYWMFVASLSGHASQLNLKVCLLFLQVITECRVFPSDLKRVSIVNLTPLCEFWNSCFENSRGNYHQYNCLLFFFFFPLFSIHTGEPGSCC